MFVYVYSAIPSHSERIPILLSGVAKIKKRLRLIADHLVWRAFGAFTFRYDNYNEHVHSNSGDVAIRAAVIDRMRAILASDNVEIVEVGWGELCDELVGTINGNGALFVIAGGGYFTIGGNGALSSQAPNDLPFIEAITCPKVAYSIGINRNTSITNNTAVRDVDIVTMKNIINQMSLAAVRDYNSKNILETAGVRVPVVADPVCFTACHERGARDSERLSVGLNFSAHGHFAMGLLKSYWPLYCDLVKYVVLKYNPRLYYMQHSESESVVVKILFSKGFDLNVVNVPSSEISLAYSKLDVNICQMLHSSIFCFSQNVPALNVGYDQKNNAFYDMLGMGEYCLNVHVATLSDLSERFDSIVANRSLLRDHMARVKSGLAVDRDKLDEQIVKLSGIAGPATV